MHRLPRVETYLVNRRRERCGCAGADPRKIDGVDLSPPVLRDAVTLSKQLSNRLLTIASSTG